MSNEDNKHDTNYINKHKDANHDARKLHKWARHIERAVSVRHDDLSWYSLLKFIESSISCHPHVAHVSFSLIFTYLPFYFDLSFTVFFHSSVLIAPWHAHRPLQPGLRGNNLRHSAKESLDAIDVTHSLTGYKPNDTVSNDTVKNELVDSQGPFSYVTPSSDQDIDDTTLGKLLTEAHREHADYRSLEGVCQSVVSVCRVR